MKNTQVEFYRNWSQEEMVNELVRLNQILLDIGSNIGIGLEKASSLVKESNNDGKCTNCNKDLSKGERWNGNPNLCMKCDRESKKDNDIKIYDKMIERHNAYKGSGRCSLSCSICIKERVK